MKKVSKSKSSDESQEAQPSIAELILKVQQQLSFLEKKIDTLIGQQASRPASQPVSQPFSQPRFDQQRHQGAPRQDNDYRQRVLHKAVCADCSKECEVPFKPSQDRPVYCKDCFSKRKAGASSFGERPDSAPRHTGSAREGHFDKPHGGPKKKFFEKGKFFEKKKFYEKKRPGAKKRKSSRG